MSFWNLRFVRFLLRRLAVIGIATLVGFTCVPDIYVDILMGRYEAAIAKLTVLVVTVTLFEMQREVDADLDALAKRKAELEKLLDAH